MRGHEEGRAFASLKMRHQPCCALGNGESQLRIGRDPQSYLPRQYAGALRIVIAQLQHARTQPGGGRSAGVNAEGISKGRAAARQLLLGAAQRIGEALRNLRILQRLPEIDRICAFVAIKHHRAQ